MWYTEMTPDKVQPEYVVGAGTQVLCVENIVRQDKDVFLLNCHVLFCPEKKRQLALAVTQVVSVAFGGNARETETIQ